MAINTGKKPNPPFVKETVKLPITKATNAVPKLIELVSFKLYSHWKINLDPYHWSNWVFIFIIPLFLFQMENYPKH